MDDENEQIAHKSSYSGQNPLPFQAKLEFARHTIKLPPKSPNLNAYAERFVRTIKESCLDQMIFFGEDMLRNAIRELVTHYHLERNHQGVENRLLVPLEITSTRTPVVQKRERLSGLLNYYYREAA